MLLQRILALTTLFIAAIQPGFGQSGEPVSNGQQADTRQDRKEYLVEIIVFRYLGPDSSAGEDFDSLYVSDYFPPAPFDIEEYTRVREAVSYTELDYLSDALERLSADRQYAVMTKLAWVQPLLNKEEAIDVEIGDGAPASNLYPDTDTPAVGSENQEPGQNLDQKLREGLDRELQQELSGTVRVYGDYLLFVDLDLRAELPREPGGPDMASPGESGFETIIGSGTAASRETAPRSNVFHIAEKRRIKLEEFHYFDHPYIGAIVSVTRHEGSDGGTTDQ